MRIRSEISEIGRGIGMLSKYDLCGRCREIDADANGYRTVGQALEESEGNEFMIIMTYKAIRYALNENGGCSSCIGKLDRILD